eukprot:2249162-Rhodomonas_salina.1
MPSMLPLMPSLLTLMMPFIYLHADVDTESRDSDGDIGGSHAIDAAIDAIDPAIDNYTDDDIYAIDTVNIAVTPLKISLSQVTLTASISQVILMLSMSQGINVMTFTGPGIDDDIDDGIHALDTDNDDICGCSFGESPQVNTPTLQ